MKWNNTAQVVAALWTIQFTQASTIIVYTGKPVLGKHIVLYIHTPVVFTPPNLLTLFVSCLQLSIYF